MSTGRKRTKALLSAIITMALGRFRLGPEVMAVGMTARAMDADQLIASNAALRSTWGF